MNSTHTEKAEINSFCYEYLNGSCPKFVYPLFLKVPLYLFFGSVVILTVFGNLFVIITVVHFKQLHMPTNFLVLSLAVTDLLLGALFMPPFMIQSVETCWYLGNIFYRYYAVCHPLLYHSKITSFVTLIMIVICWTFSAAIGFIIIYLELNILGVEEFYYENVACEGGCVLFQSAASSTSSSVLSFYIPGVIMLSIYMKIFRVAQKQAKSIQDSKCKSNIQSVLSKEEKKATKTLAVVLGVFLSLWTPFFICNVMNPFIGYTIPPVLIEMFGWIGFMNSTCNPIVYAFFYKWFRKAFRIIISGQIFQPGSSRTNLFSH
ncbi:trace amine-associated receptor 1-like [Astyanax mexicanus]|uniref:trace amine-associated receptor 1-like n=1 Tax=Astyanax mexicanus TaxID=7994 RepID=UPI0020CB195F|nr:trace amine-associated receptor 1-like [Astyanax mexicanus]